MLARWAGWGAVPKVFDDRDEQFAAERAELRRLLGTEEAWAQARRTTLNAHYTSASVVSTMWGAASALGVDGPVRVLEPGCGSGNFLGLAPEDAVLTGVELDATTANDRRAPLRRPGHHPHRRVRGAACRGRRLRPGHRQRPVRQGHPARSPPQPGPPRPAQLLPPQEPPPDATRRDRDGPHLPLHARRPQPIGPPRDGRSRRPGRRHPAPRRARSPSRRAPTSSSTCWSCAAAYPERNRPARPGSTPSPHSAKSTGDRPGW